MAYFQKRSGSWRAIVKRKGFDRITQTFDTKATAEAWARQIEAEMDRGVYFSRKEAEATSRLFDKGFDTMEVRTITGHKTLQMLARYTHLRAEDLAKRMK